MKPDCDNYPSTDRKLRWQPHIVGLDALRFFAASLVMLYHFCFWHWTRGQPLLIHTFGLAPFWANTFHFGWVGVEIFFVISGFVITGSAFHVHATQFFRSRFLRLVPAVWICATISLVWQSFGLQRELYPLFMDYASSVLFWPMRSIDGVYWTLGIEVSFYAFVYYLLRIERVQFLEKSMGVIGIASGLFWASSLLFSHVLEDRTGVLGTFRYLVLKAEGNRWLQLLLIQHGCLFALGVVLSRIFTDGLTKNRTICFSILIGSCLLEIVGQNTIIERASGIDLSFVPAICVWVLAMIVFGVSLRQNERLLSIFRNQINFFKFFGRLTYPLYLIHNTVVFWVIVLLAPFFGYYSILIGVVAALIAAGLVAEFAEPALRDYISTLWFPRLLRAKP
jgi:peptidoglycan/LPS O-acetylase OafA/YrhL